MNYYNMLLVLSLSALPMLAIAAEAPVDINQTSPKVEEPQEFLKGDTLRPHAHYELSAIRRPSFSTFHSNSSGWE